MSEDATYRHTIFVDLTNDDSDPENMEATQTSKYSGSLLHKLTSSVLCSSSSQLSVTVFIRILFIIDSAGFPLLAMTCVED